MSLEEEIRWLRAQDLHDPTPNNCVTRLPDNNEPRTVLRSAAERGIVGRIATKTG